MCVWTNLSFVYSGVRSSTRRSWVNVDSNQAPALASTALSKQKRTRDTPERENVWRVERKEVQWNRPSGPVSLCHNSCCHHSIFSFKGDRYSIRFYTLPRRRSSQSFHQQGQDGGWEPQCQWQPVGSTEVTETAPARARGTVDRTPTWGPILLGNCATRPQHPLLHSVFHNGSLHRLSALPVTVHPPPGGERLWCSRIRPVTRGYSAVDLYSPFPLFYGYGNTLNFVL